MIYISSEVRSLPNLMSRFREEHYATRAHKAFTRRERSEKDTVAALWRESRAQYFQKSPEVRQAIRKAQKARVNNG